MSNTSNNNQSRPPTTAYEAPRTPDIAYPIEVALVKLVDSVTPFPGLEGSGMGLMPSEIVAGKLGNGGKHLRILMHELHTRILLETKPDSEKYEAIYVLPNSMIRYGKPVVSTEGK